MSAGRKRVSLNCCSEQLICRLYLVLPAEPPLENGKLVRKESHALSGGKVVELERREGVSGGKGPYC